MQQLECESNSITCMSCLYVHVYGNKVIYLSIYLSITYLCRQIKKFALYTHLNSAKKSILLQKVSFLACPIVLKRSFW